ncbi:MAG TPA: endonuclease/exonuclease/phosphatase family protein [Myxococcota bacterium]|nr:endonuclease/exonuclease/phosphatase family protein [Myxococcota bacterium]
MLLGKFPHLINWFPAPVEPVPVVSRGEGRSLRPGDEFSALTWNIQYAASHRYTFFYDDGPTVGVPAEVVHETLAAIAGVLHEVDADLVLLQEVDRGARRTAGIDELAELWDKLDYPAWVGCPYHRSAFVPKPVREPMGRVELWMATFSRFAMQRAERRALVPLQEPWYVRRFNLKRAILSAEVGPLRLANVHLSAFANGDGTVPKQIAALKAWMGEGPNWLVGGDFNALPPGDDRARLGRWAKEYADATPPLAELLPAVGSAIPLERLLLPENRSYLPPEAQEPDRVLDYLFHSPTVEVIESRVLKIPAWISDHLPVWGRFRYVGS